MAGSTAAPDTATRSRWEVTAGCCLDCAGDVSGALRRVAGVADATVLAAGNAIVVTEAEPVDDAAVRDAAAKLGLQVRRAGDERTAPEVSRAWWRTPRVLSLLAAAVVLIIGLVAERLPGGNGVADVAYWVTLLVGGWAPALSGWRAARSGRLTISTLLVVAAAGAVALGIVEEAALLVVVFSLGEVLEEYVADRARGSIRALMALTPDTARLRTTGGELVTVPAVSLQPGDIAIVRPGERVPTDGCVVGGASAVDQSPVTGESVPVDVAVGDEVFSGSINGPGALEIEATRHYEDTTLARVIAQVQQAQASKGTAQRFADRFGAVYTPAMFALAAVLAVVPPLLVGDGRAWWYRALVVLVVSCSCALVMSVPTSVVAAVTRAARDGILIKGGAYLEALGRVRVVAFDKTGTLTAGRPQVTDVIPTDGMTADGVLALAAAVEALNHHPLANAIVAAANHRNLAVSVARDLRATVGTGVEATVDGSRVFVGRPSGRLAGHGWVAQRLSDLERAGKTAVVVSDGDRPLGVLGIADQLRPDAAQVVQRLHRDGLHTVMLTGDNERVAAAIADQLRVADWRARLLPEDKTAAVQDLHREHADVAMVGDGVNDAPALATADVGIAMGAAGTDIALETADVALMTDDLYRLTHALALAHRARRNIQQNIAVSLLTVAALIVAAVTGHLSLTSGLLLNEGTALLIITNGLRLLHAHPAPNSR